MYARINVSVFVTVLRQFDEFCWKLGQCCVALHYEIVENEQILRQFPGQPYDNQSEKDVPKAIPWCNLTQQRPSPTENLKTADFFWSSIIFIMLCFYLPPP